LYNEEPSTASFPLQSPTDIIPIPKGGQGKKRASRQKGKTAVLTSSPYKNELVAAAGKAQVRNGRKVLPFQRRE
jgi:hypothetical protein